ncbi:hypothetical protein [Streptomyces sp. NPDC059893]|uniref:ATP-dependent DNA ligase n=1 Tax=Streptomyces sp. NPDC059893 TaxID=3346990 RepID=UPI0036495D89
MVVGRDGGPGLQTPGPEVHGEPRVEEVPGPGVDGGCGRRGQRLARVADDGAAGADGRGERLAVRRPIEAGFRPVRCAETANPFTSVFDVLAHDGQDVRGHPYTERRALLLDLLHDVPPPIQAVPATDDPDVAQLWYDTLRDQGIEGVVCKAGLFPIPGRAHLVC